MEHGVTTCDVIREVELSGIGHETCGKANTRGPVNSYRALGRFFGKPRIHSVNEGYEPVTLETRCRICSHTLKCLDSARKCLGKRSSLATNAERTDRYGMSQIFHSVVQYRLSATWAAAWTNKSGHSVVVAFHADFRHCFRSSTWVSRFLTKSVCDLDCRYSGSRVGWRRQVSSRLKSKLKRSVP